MMRSAPPAILPDPPEPPMAVGVIGAGGRLPILVAQGLKRAGHKVVGIGLAGQYEEEFRALCASFRDVQPLRIGSWVRAVKRQGASHAVMVGRIDKARLMHSWWNIIRAVPDRRVLTMWWQHRRDRRSSFMLRAVADELASKGVLLIDSTAHIREHMATQGAMTKRSPSASQKADIDFGWPILRDLLRLDVGQAIAVRERDVIAVEAVEGTDRMIERAGALCASGGWTLLKAARAGHDRRSDVPVIGPDTIRNVHKAGARCIALAADDVIIIDKPQTLELADSLGVAVFGLAPM
ncbi:MAG: LpxI family protein [Phycisphaeraceae bacterium]|nr:UDP-2,3-diacylglucosamine diphosphatase LpxI [Phycisphaerales bacterium]MCB9844086.1 LpxI family protein [Phycisphaeraceae bacterium]